MTRRPSEWLWDAQESERLVLGLLVYAFENQYEAIDRASEVLAVEDFFADRHQILYGAILALRNDGKSVDSEAILDRVRAGGNLRQWGEGREGEDELLKSINDLAYGSIAIHALGLETHLDLVREASLRRAMFGMAQAVLKSCEERKPALDMAGEADRAISAAIARTSARDTVTMATAMQGYPETVKRRREQGPAGLLTGLMWFDGVVGGFLPGELVVLAARPSIGKTALALEVATLIARRANVGILVVSLEMPREQLIDRMVASTSEVGLKRILEGDELDDGEQQRLEAASAHLAGLPIWFDDCPRRTITQIAANARRRHRDGVRMIVVDYIQIITEESSQGRRNGSREEVVAEFARRLKQLARELSVPVLCLCQLNRQAEGRKDRKPMLSDLRESGAIEQDADKVLLLHRPAFYDPTDRPGQADVIVAKNRNGTTGTVVLQYASEIVKFRNFDHRPGPPGRPY